MAPDLWKRLHQSPQPCDADIAVDLGVHTEKPSVRNASRETGMSEVPAVTIPTLPSAGSISSGRPKTAVLAIGS